MTALEDLTALVANLPNSSLLNDTMKNRALAGALMPDVNKVWPGNDAYINTYDIYYAAISLIGFLQAQPVVRQSSSEGTSVAVDAPQWDGLITWYKSMSPIFQATGISVLGFIEIPDGDHVHRTNMHDYSNSGRFGFDNVDTDSN